MFDVKINKSKNLFLTGSLVVVEEPSLNALIDHCMIYRGAVMFEHSKVPHHAFSSDHKHILDGLPETDAVIAIVDALNISNGREVYWHIQSEDNTTYIYDNRELGIWRKIRDKQTYSLEELTTQLINEIVPPYNL